MHGDDHPLISVAINQNKHLMNGTLVIGCMDDYMARMQGITFCLRGTFHGNGQPHDTYADLGFGSGPPPKKWSTRLFVHVNF